MRDHIMNSTRWKHKRERNVLSQWLPDLNRTPTLHYHAGSSVLLRKMGSQVKPGSRPLIQSLSINSFENMDSIAIMEKCFMLCVCGTFSYAVTPDISDRENRSCDQSCRILSHRHPVDIA